MQILTLSKKKNNSNIKNIQIDIGSNLNNSVFDHIGAAGFDPLFGARPLKRAIQQELENPLAQQILSGKLLPNKDVVVDCENGGIVAKQ